MYKHYSQAGWVAVRKQSRLIQSILFDGSSLVTQDVIVLLIVSVTGVRRQRSFSRFPGFCILPALLRESSGRAATPRVNNSGLD